MNKKRILVVAQFTQLPREKGNNRGRFKLICEMLSDKGFEVTEVTSNFCDLDKSQRCYNNDEFINEPYKIEILNDPGYTNTVSLRRFYSQFVFAKNLKKWLKNSEKFDLVYISVYPLEPAKAILKYCKKNKIPFVIDIQDLFPEVLKMVIKNKYIYNILTYPFKKYADNIYKNADGVVAVSNTYLNRALSINKKGKIGACVYIGTNLSVYDNALTSCENGFQKGTGQFWVTYIGSLSQSYDILTLIKAVKILRDENKFEIRLNILGSGPLEDTFKDYCNELKVDVNFTGWLDYKDMVSYLDKSDLLVNAIKKNAPQSITNKIADYLSSGIPIINGSLNKEFIDIINSNKLGINYEPENVISLVNAIKEVYNMNINDRQAMGKRARKLAEDEFDRKNTYGRIIELINKLLKK